MGADDNQFSAARRIRKSDNPGAKNADVITPSQGVLGRVQPKNDIIHARQYRQQLTLA